MDACQDAGRLELSFAVAARKKTGKCLQGTVYPAVAADVWHLLSAACCMLPPAAISLVDGTGRDKVSKLHASSCM